MKVCGTWSDFCDFCHKVSVMEFGLNMAPGGHQLSNQLETCLVVVTVVFVLSVVVVFVVVVVVDRCIYPGRQ